MKKSLSLLLVLLLASTMVFAQGTKDATGDDGKVTEIKIWSRVGGGREFEIENLEEWNQTLGKDAGIRVVSEFFGSDYDDVLTLARNTGKLPDLFASRNKVEDWVASDSVMAIDDLPGGDALVEKYSDYIVDGISRFDGKVYSIKNVANTFRLVANKTLLAKSGFDSLPETWEELRMMAKKVTKDNNSKKFGIAFPLKFGNNGEHFWRLCAIYGLSNTYGFESWYNQSTSAYDFAALKPVFELMREFQKDKSYLPGAEGLDNDTARAEFAAGNLAFMYAASWDYGVYTSQFPIGDKFEWEVMEMPGTHEHTTPLSPGVRFVDAINKDTKVPLDKLFYFLDTYIYSDEYLGKAYEAGVFLPIMPSITSRVEGGITKQWSDFAPTDNDSVETPRPDSFVSIDGKSWPEVFMLIWSDPTMDIDSALADLDRRYNAGLDKAIEKGDVDPSIY
ncbi:MAG: ABC transporter substrate-binding protein [Sphaerochaetaceae bacterium]